MSQNTQYPKANPLTAIFFHGLYLIPYSTGNKKYVPIKPITDLIGIDWRNVKRNLSEGDNVGLFGAKRILVPKIDNLGGLMTPQTALNTSVQADLEPKDGENIEFTDILCIRFDRVHLYLARVNTTRLRVNGNVESADYLLKLQHEWGDVLHNYETHGIAINKSKLEHAKYLKQLFDLYTKADKPHQRKVLSEQIDEALGVQAPLPKADDPQGDLLNQ